MDTTNYDTKMAELRAAASNGQLTKEAIDKVVRVGRPKGPDKVVFKRNVEPQLVAQLDALIKGDSKPKEAYEIKDVSKEGSNEVEDLKRQLNALLEDNEKLTTLVANQEAKIQKVARLTDNEKLILWIRKYDELKQVYDKRFGASEHSQV